MTRTTLRDAALMSLASAFAGATSNGDINRHRAAKNRMNLVMAEKYTHQRGSDAERSADGAG